MAVASAPYAWRPVEPVAVRFLRASPAMALADRVDELTAQRADTTVAQAAEIRRIERDLHDGAQARLVALGLSLATAEKLMETDPDRAKALLREARAGAATSLTELRELVQGINPPVLNERGLVDAVRAFALDSPLEVAVSADVELRLDPPIESALYFGIAELLTNAVKHAQATRARISIAREPTPDIVVEVEDNGRGGADVRAGGGLAGLRRRLAVFDGTLEITSPAGGPTRVEDGGAMRIVVAEDLYLLRDGMVRLIEAYGHQVVATATTGPETLDALLKWRPDVAVVDVRMPPTQSDEGLRAALAARREVPGLPVLILSQHVEQLYARELLADGTGGIGYLLKDSVFDADQFIDALERVAAGGTAMDPAVIAKLLSSGTSNRRLERLTEREHDVLSLMAEGLSNQAICQRLFLSESAVSKHTTSLFGKLGITDDDTSNRRVLAVLAYLNKP